MSKLTMLRTPGPSLTFPWMGLTVSCPDTPHTPATLVPPKAGSMVSLCPEATSAPRPSSQGTCPNHRGQLLPSPPLSLTRSPPGLSGARPWSGILPLGELSLIKWAAAAFRRPVWTPGQLLRGLA